MAPEWAYWQLDWLAAAQDQGAMGNGHWAALRVGRPPAGDWAAAGVIGRPLCTRSTLGLLLRILRGGRPSRSLACGFGFGDDNWRLFACVCP